MTRSELRVRVLQSLNDTIPTHWSIAQINTLIDDAAQYLAEHSRPFHATAFLPLQDGTNYYFTTGLNPECMAPSSITLLSSNKRLTASSFTELDQMMLRWDNVTGDPWVWVPVSWDCFMIWPRPATGGGLLRVDYLAWPKTQIDDSDELEISEADMPVIINYAVTDSLLKRFDALNASISLGVLDKSIVTSQGQHGGGKTSSRWYQRGSGPNLPTGDPRKQ